MNLKSSKKSNQFFKAGYLVLILIGLIVLIFLILRSIPFDDWFRDKSDLTPVSSKINNALPEDLNYEEIEEIYDFLRNNYDGKLSEEELLIGLKKGLVKAVGDVHTEYFDATETELLEEELSGSFSGIGAELTINENGHIIIVSPIIGYPAQKAGLKIGDQIYSVDGQSTHDKTLIEVISQIRGPIGTQVTLGIHRDGIQKPFDVTLTRALISISSVESKVVDSIGILQVSRFVDDDLSIKTQIGTTKAALAAIKDFQKQEIKGIILDLRFNPGGSLEETLRFASLWLKNNQPVTLIGFGDDILETTYPKEPVNTPLAGLPLIILINQGSASAAEIIAGALKYHLQAPLVGEKTFGKGSVQILQPLDNSETLKLTFRHWFTPDKKGIDKVGLMPDYQVVDDQNTEIDEVEAWAIKLIKQKF